MFVKKSWNTRSPNPKPHYSLVESFRDPETGRPRHRTLMNLSLFPLEVIHLIDQSLRGRTFIDLDELAINQGDCLRGAGTLAVLRAWDREDFAGLLDEFTPAQKQSMLAMVVQRILHPGSKLSLKGRFRDTLMARSWSQKRLDEDELYHVMDILHEHFYDVQERLYARRGQSPLLCLYDITSTYFEGTHAEDGAYGHCRDKRWDRYQIVIGLVCDEEGVPLAIEVWPGNTADKTTVVDRITVLKQRFGIEAAVFVGDAGMYTQANVEALESLGFDYILRVDWQTERSQLEALAPEQLDLLDRYGIAEWEEEGVRYVGCLSQPKRLRAKRRREAGMVEVNGKLEALSRTASRGKYYSWTRLREKVNDILQAAGVKDLWQVDISYLDEDPGSPEKKARLQLMFSPDEAAIQRREYIEGVYILRTSVAAGRYEAWKIDEEYRRLQKAGRTFRHIKSSLEIRPIYHYLRRRVRAHVLICFLAYYLVKIMEIELRAKGVTEEVEPLLRRWDQLEVVETRLEVRGKVVRTEWNWSLGDNGAAMREEISTVGWWRSVDAYRRSLTRSLGQSS